ncbi:MAG: hypothetical protein C4519_20705 [Desulfobacteraceae bacterium]|nr:MAG: hypothetical protein C4519_20705 [Desulfobacteraceae bacterium]
MGALKTDCRVADVPAKGTIPHLTRHRTACCNGRMRQMQSDRLSCEKPFLHDNSFTKLCPSYYFFYSNLIFVPNPSLNARNDELFAGPLYRTTGKTGGPVKEMPIFADTRSSVTASNKVCSRWTIQNGQ